VVKVRSESEKEEGKASKSIIKIGSRWGDTRKGIATPYPFFKILTTSPHLI